MNGRITEKDIKKLNAPSRGSQIKWDSEIPGFGVRVTAAGVFAFILTYRISGRQRRYTIGRHPELTVAAARNMAGDLRQMIREGQDPMERRIARRQEPCLADLAAEYLLRHAEPNKRPSSLRDDRRMLERNICPKLGKLRVEAVGKRDIELLHQSLKATPYSANRVLALLSKMFSLAIEWTWTATNPTLGIPRFPEDKRQCWLTIEEMQRFRQALDSYPDQNAANALRLLLLTGARAGEVLKAEWQHFDFARGVWTKPRHNTKQKREEHVPLSAQAIQLLLSMAPESATGPLFPGTKGRTRVSLKRPWIQACKLSGMVTTATVTGKRGPRVRYRATVRIHDLRHNYASHLASSGVSLQVVGKLLGHTQTATTSRYAHLQDAVIRAATNEFGALYDNNGHKQLPSGSYPIACTVPLT